MDLHYFSDEDFHGSLKRFFKELGIPVSYIAVDPTTAGEILENTYKPNNPAHQLMDDVYVLGMVDDAAFKKQTDDLHPELREKAGKDCEGLLIFGVTLNSDKDRLPARGHMFEITRAFNREFHYMPVVVVFKYQQYISFANCERTAYDQKWREGEKVGRVSLLKDVDTRQPHTGHLEILQLMVIMRKGKGAITSFEGLYQYWREVLSISTLSKDFYKKLSDWYFWAVENITFPKDAKKDKDGKYSISVLRLITRLIFIWFMKEKGLIPPKLFEKDEMSSYLNDLSDNESTYYKAILQNLFFATLNTPIRERKFRTEKRCRKGWNKDFGDHHVYRHHKLFRPEADWKELFVEMPFLNGGLFDCLDNKRQGIYVDGFSATQKHQPVVPNLLFFAPKKQNKEYGVNLNKTYSTSKEKYELSGIIHILKSYKFTIAENTPLEQEIALDPDLLGIVFESLLAYYNPETQATARKQTGSFYTPREIVEYMVSESLKAYLENSLTDYYRNKLRSRASTPLSQADILGKTKPVQTRLAVNVKKLSSEEISSIRQKLGLLFDYNCLENPFNPEETRVLIKAVSKVRILDPACGSGAFPMGILDKMVYLLSKLDKDNTLWKILQIENIDELLQEVEADIKTAKNISIRDIREQTVAQLKERKKQIPKEFARNIQQPNFTRKLYLIRDCIYGVDIQDIAVLICKLRFFISLLVDTVVSRYKENWDIKPLPNLETKFVAANTLIDIKGQLPLKPESVTNLEEKN